ncbi:MAG: sulfotransferase, partial [Pirellulaceae bacterium]
MPNSRNVESPISLVGLGRSGTTVLQAAFGRHPAVQVCGETFGIISSLWAGSMTSFLENDFLHQAQSPLKQDEKAAHYIRACMCALCPGERPHWFHKPIGMPKFLNWKWLPGDKSPIT